MNAEQERVLRNWLDDRDPGAAPDRLRGVARQASFEQRPLRWPRFQQGSAWCGSTQTAARVAALALVVLALLVAIAIAALLRPPRQFPPPGLIAYTTAYGTGGIRVIAADGTGNQALTPSDHDKSPRWSPDGRSLLYIRFVDAAPGSECAEETSIVVHDLEDGTERILATEPVVVAAEWSPSGSQIVFGGLGGPCELSGSGVIDVVSGRVTASDTGAGAFPIWTGDAITLLYPGHLGRVAVSEIGGNPPVETVLTFDGTHLANPSPDGRYAALSGLPDDLSVPLEIVDLTDGSRMNLGPGSGGWWSPDGEVVAFVQPGMPDVEPGQSRDRLVVTVGTDRALRPIADVVIPGGSPTAPVGGAPKLHWTPDGRALYWQDANGAHVADVESGRSADLPRALFLSFSFDMEWQPVP
jgi:hypothetical protein